MAILFGPHFSENNVSKIKKQVIYQPYLNEKYFLHAFNHDSNAATIHHLHLQIVV